MGLPSFITPIMGKKQGYLPLTAAWIAATGETDTTILNALNTFEGTLISNSLSSLITAYYPMVGGTSTKHAFNFMNTALYNLSFVGGWTHSANGALPNGTNGYANTFLPPNPNLNAFNSHLSYYSRTNTAAANRIAMGSATAPAYLLANQIIIRFTDGNYYGAISSNGALAFVTNSNTTGFYVASRTADNSMEIYKNNSLVGTNTTTIANSSTIYSIFIGARNQSGTPGSYDNKQCAGVTIGLGLTSGQVSTLSTAINTLNTALSRNVY